MSYPQGNYARLMGLLDWFRRKPAPPALEDKTLRELWGELGHHGADIETLKGRVEALRDEWASQLELMRKLVQRLEKRDQRAAEREEPEEEQPKFSPEVEGMRAIRARRSNGRESLR